MMKHLTLVFLLCLGLIPLSAQFSRSLEECAMLPQLEKHKDYEAVIIEDIGNISFHKGNDGGLEYLFRRNVRIKINTASGIEWSEFEIPLYRESQQGEYLTIVNATVYNPGKGKSHYQKTDLNIYSEKYGKNGVYDKFAIPGVIEGSLVEVEYAYTSPYLFTLEDWIFQYEVPVMESRLKIAVVPFYEYALLKRGSHPYASVLQRELRNQKHFAGVSYYERLYTFTMLNVPAFEDESFITNRRDYINRLEFQMSKVHSTTGGSREIMTNWTMVNEDLLKEENFGKYLKASSKHAKSMMGVLAGLEADTEGKVNFLTSYVKSELHWNGYNSKWSSDKLKRVWSVKEGNAADINLYLVGALRAAGLDAYPVMLSTRNHGRVYKDRPLHRSFNYVVAAVPHEGGYLLRDATDGTLPNEHLPIRCLNGKGLLVKKDAEVWVELGKGMGLSELGHHIVLEPDEKGSLLSKQVSIVGTGYDAVRMKSRVKDDSEKLEKWLNTDQLSDPDSVRILSDFDRTDSISVWLNCSSPLESMGGMIFIDPFAGLPETTCPLTQKSRTYPVDMVYRKKRCYTSEISIPEGYTASYVPEAFKISNGILDAKYQPVFSEGGKLTIEAEFTFKKRIYQASEYRSLKFFYDDMVRRLNERITLEKLVRAEP